jgi:hypothetical protein
VQKNQLQLSKRKKTVDYQIISVILGLINALAAFLILLRGQPKFALLTAVIWIAFAATKSPIQPILAIFGVSLVVVSYLYFAQWRK